MEHDLPLWDLCRTHHRDNEQSVAAHESLKPMLNHLRLRVFNAVKARGDEGATVDELEVTLGGRHQSVSARVTELKKLGLVVLTNRQRRTRSGRLAGIVIAKE